MKTKGNNKLITVILLVVLVGIGGYLFYSLSSQSARKKVKVKPLPFTGNYDSESFEKYLKLPNGEERSYQAVTQPDPAASKCRNLFTGAVRNYSDSEKTVCER